jgi:hypothetical protein
VRTWLREQDKEWYQQGARLQKGQTGNIGYGGNPHLNMDYFHDFLIFCKKKKWGIIFWATLVSSVVV